MQTSSNVLRSGLIGAGIQQSLTPAMHMAEARALGFEYDYELFDLIARGGGSELLPALLDEAEARGFRGLNITHPCKQLVLAYLDELSDEARALGAVNTVVLRDGRRYGHNTDWWGFSESFRRGLPEADLAEAVQIGAGGAGVATAYAILSLGLEKLTVFDREAERAEQLAQAMSALFPQAQIDVSDDLPSAMRNASGVIHATPTGMAKYPGVPLPPSLLQAHHWLAEIVYFPLETELLKQAKQRGCRVLNGGGMAVYQAVGAFRLFTGREPDAERMARHFRSLTHTGHEKTAV
jgi:shikimate dehydrogenase